MHIEIDVDNRKRFQMNELSFVNLFNIAILAIQI